MPINRLYGSLRDLLVQLRPKERKTRIRNFSWLLVGLFLSRSVHLSRIASKIPSTTTRVCLMDQKAGLAMRRYR